MKLYFEPGIEPWGRPAKPDDLSPEDVSATFPDHAPNKIATFWVERLEPNTVRQLHLSTEALAEESVLPAPTLQMETDSQGWGREVGPTSVLLFTATRRWPVAAAN
jgi:hypothetical protein